MEGDEAAIARARAGDRDAFREVVERHSRVVFRLGYRMTGNEQDAEEVVQETFLHAWRWIGRFESRSGFSTWLHRIAVNCSMDLLRRRSRRDPVEGSEEILAVLPDHAPGPERLAGSGELREHVRTAIAELSPLERAAFVLRHFEGLRIEEIARRLDRREDATKNSIFRAVQKVRRALGAYAASR
jgi:RNA polymerase sigma-70 factor (ECF subfamily)